MKKKILVGIDISNEKLDVAVVKKNAAPLKAIFSFEVANSLEGLESLLEQLKEQKIKPSACCFCFEHTGNYGLLLASFLHHHKLLFCAVPALEIKNSSGMTRGKNDRIDAERIALYAAKHTEKLRAAEPLSQHLLKVKQLLTYRDQLVKSKTQWNNRFKSHKKHDAIMEEITGICEEIDSFIETIKQKIKDVEKQIHALLKEPALKKNYQLVKSITGIGPVLSAYLMVTTNNFTRFNSARQYNTFIGVAPFEDSSGTINKQSKVSNLRHKRLKALFISGAKSAINFDPEQKTYYQKKLKEGKHENSVVNAVACKLIGRCFAVVKRQSPYVKLYGQTFSSN